MKNFNVLKSVQLENIQRIPSWDGNQPIPPCKLGTETWVENGSSKAIKRGSHLMGSGERKISRREGWKKKKIVSRCWLYQTWGELPTDLIYYEKPRFNRCCADLVLKSVNLHHFPNKQQYFKIVIIHHSKWNKKAMIYTLFNHSSHFSHSGFVQLYLSRRTVMNCKAWKRVTLQSECTLSSYSSWPQGWGSASSS